MECENVIEIFLELDNNEPISPEIQAHLEHCCCCRNEIERIQTTLQSLLNHSSFATSHSWEMQIMSQLQTSLKSEEIVIDLMSLGKWLSVGIVIASSIFLVSYSEVFIWLNLHFGKLLVLHVYILLSLVISIYSALFIAAHLDAVKKFTGYS